MARGILLTLALIDVLTGSIPKGKPGETSASRLMCFGGANGLTPAAIPITRINTSAGGGVTVPILRTMLISCTFHGLTPAAVPRVRISQVIQRAVALGLVPGHDATLRPRPTLLESARIHAFPCSCPRVQVAVEGIPTIHVSETLLRGLTLGLLWILTEEADGAFAAEGTWAVETVGRWMAGPLSVTLIDVPTPGRAGREPRTAMTLARETSFREGTVRVGATTLGADALHADLAQLTVGVRVADLDAKILLTLFPLGTLGAGVTGEKTDTAEANGTARAVLRA